MKLKYYFLVILFLAITGSVFAQDKILDRNGNEYLVKVLEITPDSVFYRTAASSKSTSASSKPEDTTTYAISKTAVFMITYPNGLKDVFQQENSKTEAPEKAEAPQLSRQAYYQIGRQDARKNFNSSGAYWGTFAATAVPMILIGPAGGIATGLAVGLTDPKEKNVVASKPEYKKNPDYMEGYNKQAKNKKLGSAAGGFGTALGIYVVLIAALISSLY